MPNSAGRGRQSWLATTLRGNKGCIERVRELWRRLRAWITAHRRGVLIGTGAFFTLLVVIAVVAPVRRATTLAASRIALVVLAPLVPSIKGFDQLDQPSTVVAADGSLLGTVNGGGGDAVKLAALPAVVKHAAMAAEDQNFYGHGGIDPGAMARAVIKNLTGHHEGGSTITQQLAKINYAGSSHTIFRKVREALYALKLEQKYSKDQLLERYLNQVYFGDGAYGIAAAARTTFNVEPSALTPAQAALLTGRIRGPASRSPRTHPQLATARRNVVLRIMHERHWLTDADYHAAVATPVTVVPRTTGAGGAKAPHFVEYVKREASGLDGLGGSPESRNHQLVAGGLRIETTLDPKAFDGATAAVRAQLGAQGDPSAAVVSVVPGDGAIRSLFGGLDPSLSFDVGSQGHRQTGSSFKPFVYLAALRAKIDPRSLFDGTSPKTLTYNGQTYTVDNFEGESPGPITIDDALTHSVNTVFAQLVLQPGVGPGAVVQAATDAGVNGDNLTHDRNRPSVALGGLTRGVSPLEMATAYATFAAKGVRADPYSIVRIRDRTGRVIYEHRPHKMQVLDPQLVGVLNNALIQVVQKGTGTAAQVPGWTVGGKTGTTQNFGDAWFVGITPPLATAVWVGDPERIVPMTNVHGRRVNGGSYPASIFSASMRAALAGVAPQPLFTASPDGLGLTIVNAPTTTSSTSTSSTTTTVPDTSTEVVTAPPPTEPPPTEPPRTTTTRPPTTTTISRPPATTTTTHGKP